MPLAAQDFAAGFQGTVTVAAIDWDVSEWNANITTEFAETTNTRNFDPVTGKCWTSGIGTVSDFQGSFTFFYDKNNDPYPTISDGTRADGTFLMRSGLGFAGPIVILGLEIKPGGMKGVGSVTANFRSNGVITHVTPPVVP
jgi:hypothetical protein